ncbi:MAG: hypothetical protein GEU74_08535 [Nitriliruptorales bacterium]|nr:hypothetical protein [Nitriliruptorales bacterium]
MIRGLLGFRRESLFTTEELARIRQPTLMIWGDHDPVGSLDAARAAAALIPHGRVVELPTGHAPWFGQPERTAREITNFLDEPSPTA